MWDYWGQLGRGEEARPQRLQKRSSNESYIVAPRKQVRRLTKSSSKSIQDTWIIATKIIIKIASKIREQNRAGIYTSSSAEYNKRITDNDNMDIYIKKKSPIKINGPDIRAHFKITMHMPDVDGLPILCLFLFSIPSAL